VELDQGHVLPICDKAWGFFGLAPVDVPEKLRFSVSV
jgi:hypothetical protein